MTAKHTPTPWEAIQAKDHEGDETISIRGNACFIATMDVTSIDGRDFCLTPENRANAALIVRAVNYHDRLVDIAHRLVAWESDPDRFGGDLADLGADARALLAEIEGES